MGTDPKLLENVVGGKVDQEADGGEDLGGPVHWLCKQLAQPCRRLPLPGFVQWIAGSLGPPALAGRCDRLDQARTDKPRDRVVQRAALQVEELVLLSLANQALHFVW